MNVEKLAIPKGKEEEVLSYNKTMKMDKWKMRKNFAQTKLGVGHKGETPAGRGCKLLFSSDVTMNKNPETGKNCGTKAKLYVDFLFYSSSSILDDCLVFFISLQVKIKKIGGRNILHQDECVQNPGEKIQVPNIHTQF